VCKVRGIMPDFRVLLAHIMHESGYASDAPAVELAAQLWNDGPPPTAQDIVSAFVRYPKYFTDLVESRRIPPQPRAAYGGARPMPNEAPAPPAVQMTDNSAVKEKVNGLAMMAIGDANENEARNAAVEACRLLLKHKLLQ
jgi:hypothetical protein